MFLPTATYLSVIEALRYIFEDRLTGMENHSLGDLNESRRNIRERECVYRILHWFVKSVKRHSLHVRVAGRGK